MESNTLAETNLPLGKGKQVARSMTQGSLTGIQTQPMDETAQSRQRTHPHPY